MWIDKLIDFLNGFNIQNILMMVLIIWYFTKDLKTSLESKIDSLDKDLKEMNKEMYKMNTRISHVEGTVYGKEIYKNLDQ